MGNDLRMLLVEIGVGLAIGLVVGFALRRKPEWCRSWTKFVLDGQWKVFAAGAALFGGAAVWCWLSGMRSHAIASAVMCLVEVFALFWYGFKRLTPEMERKIDAV